MPLGITALFPVNLDIGYISGSTERHKNNHFIHAGYSIALRSHILYLDTLKQRELFSFSCHCFYLIVINTVQSYSINEKYHSIYPISLKIISAAEI